MIHRPINKYDTIQYLRKLSREDKQLSDIDSVILGVKDSESRLGNPLYIIGAGNGDKKWCIGSGYRDDPVVWVLYDISFYLGYSLLDAIIKRCWGVYERVIYFTFIEYLRWRLHKEGIDRTLRQIKQYVKYRPVFNHEEGKTNYDNIVVDGMNYYFQQIKKQERVTIKDLKQWKRQMITITEK